MKKDSDGIRDIIEASPQLSEQAKGYFDIDYPKIRYQLRKDRSVRWHSYLMYDEPEELVYFEREFYFTRECIRDTGGTQFNLLQLSCVIRKEKIAACILNKWRQAKDEGAFWWGDDKFIDLVIDHDRLTSLHLACINGLTNVVYLLLKYGADPNIKCKYGYTAIEYAINKKFFNIVDVILTLHPKQLDCEQKLQYEDIKREYGDTTETRKCTTIYKNEVTTIIEYNPTRLNHELKLQYEKKVRDSEKQITPVNDENTQLEVGVIKKSITLVPLLLYLFHREKFPELQAVFINLDRLWPNALKVTTINEELVFANGTPVLEVLRPLIPAIDSPRRNIDEEQLALSLVVKANDKSFTKYLLSRNVRALEGDDDLLRICVKRGIEWTMLLSDAGASWYPDDGGRRPIEMANENVDFWYGFVTSTIQPLLLGAALSSFGVKFLLEALRVSAVIDNSVKEFVLRDYGEFIATNAVCRRNAFMLERLLDWCKEFSVQTPYVSTLYMLARKLEATQCVEFLVDNKYISEKFTRKIFGKGVLAIAGQELNDRMLENNIVCLQRTKTWITSLSTIDVSNNQLTHECLPVLAELAVKYGNLKCLDLSDNKISLVFFKGEESYDEMRKAYRKAFEQLLGEESSLEKINLSANNINLLSARKIAKSLKSNKNLIEIDLSDNLLRQWEFFLKDLSKHDTKNPGLKQRLTINVSGNFIRESVFNLYLEQYQSKVPKISSNCNVRVSMLFPAMKIKNDFKQCRRLLVSTNVWLVYYMSKDFLRFSTTDHATMLIEGMLKNGQRVMKKVDAGRHGKSDMQKPSSLKNPTDETSTDLQVTCMNVELDKIENLKKDYTRCLLWARNDIQARGIVNEAIMYKDGKRSRLTYGITGSGEEYNCAKYLAEIGKFADISIVLNLFGSPSCSESDDAVVLDSYFPK